MSRAFTLIEVIVVMAIVMILAGLVSLSLVSSGRGSEAESAKITVTQTIREAQNNSMANLGDKSWGVHIEPDKIVLFQDSGTGFVVGDKGNVTRIMPKGIALDTATQDIVFDKGRGSLASTVTLTIGQNGETSAIEVNEEGRIEY